MAKKDDYGIGGIKLITEPAEPKPAEADPIRPRGIGLRVSEWKRLTQIGQELGMKPHALVMVIIRDWVKRYEAGEIKTETGRRLPGQK